MSLSDTYENSMLDHVVGTTTLTFVAQIYISLHTADPGETGANEFTDSGYVRQAINWNAATITGATNNGQVTFPAIDDGTVTATHFGLWTASTAGTFIFGDAFGTSKAYVIGATPKVLDTAITVSTTGNWANFLITNMLDHILGTTSYTKPTTTVLHLYTTTVTAAGGGTEVAGAIGYTAQTTAWDAAAAGATENTSNETFGGATGSWGSVSDWALLDQGGVNFLLFGVWTTAFSPVDGDDYILNAGDLDITLT